MSGNAMVGINPSGAPQLVAVDAAGRLLTSSEPAGGADSGANTPTVTRVSSTAASQDLTAADATRHSLLLWNDDANTAYVLFGTGAASATNKSLAVPPNTGVSIMGDFYNGAMTVIWAADGAGGMDVTVIN